MHLLRVGLLLNVVLRITEYKCFTLIQHWRRVRRVPMFVLLVSVGHVLMCHSPCCTDVGRMRHRVPVHVSIVIRIRVSIRIRHSCRHSDDRYSSMFGRDGVCACVFELVGSDTIRLPRRCR